MKLLYLSTHSVLEADELKLFTEIGIDCFSLGAYGDPGGHKSLLRPGIPAMKHHQDLEEISFKYPKTNLPMELINWADVIFIMHTPEWVTENWPKFKGKKVVWRSIGQSTPTVENMIRRMRYEGLKIVRYSPMEKNIPGYLGEDAMIRFYKEPEEFGGWNGKEVRIVNMTQSLKGRRDHCHYDDIMAITEGFPTTIFGTGNDDLGPLNGGELPYELMKGQLRDNRVFVYGGTWPACYTLAFIEAMMTGIPVVSIGPKMAEELNSIPQTSRFHFFEIPDIIMPGVNGFWSDDINQLRTWIHELLQNHGLAKQIGDAGRKRAIELFGAETIREQWKSFFETLK